MKTNKLSGVALDWAVAKSLGAEFSYDSVGAMVATLNGKELGGFATKVPHGTALPNPSFKPSCNWVIAGPILAEQGIELVLQDEDSDIWWARGGRCMQTELYLNAGSYGDTPIEAAMRCYVMSKLGEEVEIPEELCS